jgi:hypothetical protein
LISLPAAFSQFAFFLVLIMDYAIVSVPAAPVRRKPDHRKEMVSQLLFGESVRILKTKGELWIKVRCLHDGYEGWMTNTLVREINEEAATTMSCCVTNELISKLAIDGKELNIPYGSTLPFLLNGKGRLADLDYDFSGGFLERDNQVLSPSLLSALTGKWLNAPYLWGGRTPLGVDCSGFVQVIYKTLGIDLPRDAWQQAREGRPVKKFKDIVAGDLAFFDNREDIIHVGILLGNEQIVHASGKVRVDIISKKGIVNSDTGKKGPRLNSVRRIWH